MKWLIPIVLFVVLVGCATQSATDPRYVVDGEQYGVTDGPFRGRWWSYYERGRSFMAGGFTKEAESDFREAIAMRAGDQRWARTYGLHFTREYFPNRELGVALLAQGEVDKAVEALRLSLSQTETARAAVYLEKALRAQITAAGGDDVTPVITDLATTVVDGGDPLERVVRFRVSDNHFLRAIRVGTQRVIVPVASQAHVVEERVRVAAAAREINVVVEDIAGNTATASTPIAIDAEGPMVSFDEPIVLPGVVRGVVADGSGVASLHINGENVALDGDSFAINVAEVNLEKPISYEAVDNAGNINRGPIPIEGAVLSLHGMGDTVFASRDHVNGLELMPLSDGRVMAYRVAQATAGPVEIAWTDMDNDTRVPMDSLVVRVRVKSKTRTPIAAISINGEPCAIVPGRSSARVSRYVYLGDDVGGREITCEVIDDKGNRAESTISVQRVLSEVEEGLPLRTVLLGAEAGLVSSSESANKAEYVVRAFTRGLEEAMRARVVNRELLPHVLLEQELSTLSEDSGVALGEIETADMILRPFYDQDSEVLSITVEVYSTALSDTPQGAQRIETLDVAAAADDREALNTLAEDLSLLYQTVFPRRKGNVTSEDGGRIVCDLGSRDGIRELMKCSVYFAEDGGDRLVGDAWVRRVDDAESRAELVVADDFPADALDGPIYIVTK